MVIYRLPGPGEWEDGQHECTLQFEEENRGKYREVTVFAACFKLEIAVRELHSPDLDEETIKEASGFIEEETTRLNEALKKNLPVKKLEHRMCFFKEEEESDGNVFLRGIDLELAISIHIEGIVSEYFSHYETEELCAYIDIRISLISDRLKQLVSLKKLKPVMDWSSDDLSGFSDLEIIGAEATLNIDIFITDLDQEFLCGDKFKEACELIKNEVNSLRAELEQKLFKGKLI